jgi:hypothetical protein
MVFTIGKVVVLFPNPALRQTILSTWHAHPWAGGHYGSWKLISILQKTSCGLTFIASFPNCQNHKSSMTPPSSLLKNIPLHPLPWSKVSLSSFLDCLFLTNLIAFSLSKIISPRFHISFLVTLPFPLLTPLNSSSNTSLVYMVSRTINSDRGPQFISAFWKHFWNHFDTCPKLSTSFHPQTDGNYELSTNSWSNTLEFMLMTTLPPGLNTFPWLNPPI